MQEVIVYRNPLAAAVWQFYSTDVGFVFLATIAVFIISILSFDPILRKNANLVSRFPSIRRMIFNGYVSLYLGAAVASVFAWWLI